jgi:hypothetical protein
MKNISNSKQAYRSHYYHDPFELYLLKGINQDEKKQNQLTKMKFIKEII